LRPSDAVTHGLDEGRTAIPKPLCPLGVQHGSSRIGRPSQGIRSGRGLHSPAGLIAALDKLGEWKCSVKATPTREVTMKARQRFGSVEIEFDGDVKEIFEQASVAAEVFGHSVCKACGSPEVRPVVREVDGNKYYEMRCCNCPCRLSFGQTKQGGKLFPRRKSSDGNWIPNGGWEDWRESRAVSASDASDEPIPF